MSSEVRRAGSSGDGSGIAKPLRVLFHYPVLNRGGAEKSILRLMAALVARDCEVHLVLTSAGGVLESEVAHGVKIHHLRTFQTWRSGTSKGAQRLLRKPLQAMRWGAGRLQEWWQRRQFKDMSFDAAFAGLAGLSPDFICNTVIAKKRFVFIRNDPAVDRNGRWARRIRDYQGRIDAYLCVSDYVREAMASRFPSISGKLITIYNLLDPDQMRANANRGGNPFIGSDLPRVLSVCRLQESNKALLRMVEVHKRLLDAGFPHEWNVLGDGPDRALLERAISEHGVAGSFKLHGAIANPFPYYKHADICAVLSRYEGLCGVVNEARVLERPVIATRFSGIDEQITSGVNGLIVEQDVEAICAGMATLLRDPALRERLAHGGYPRELLDDDAKLDALIRLLAGSNAETATVSK